MSKGLVIAQHFLAQTSKRPVKQIKPHGSCSDYPKMPDVALTFDYDLPSMTVYDWWTDLSGKGYIGKSLKSLRQKGREGNKIMVETRWKIMGFNMKMIEILTLDAPNHWIWEPHLMGIHIIDDFSLEDKGERSRLHVISELQPRGMKGKVSKMMFGNYLRRLMTEEWESADKAFRAETQSRIQKI